MNAIVSRTRWRSCFSRENAAWSFSSSSSLKLFSAYNTKSNILAHTQVFETQILKGRSIQSYTEWEFERKSKSMVKTNKQKNLCVCKVQYLKISTVQYLDLAMSLCLESLGLCTTTSSSKRACTVQCDWSTSKVGREYRLLAIIYYYNIMLRILNFFPWDNGKSLMVLI